MDEEASNLTTEECEAIKKVNVALDKCYELHCEFIQGKYIAFLYKKLLLC